MLLKSLLPITAIKSLSEKGQTCTNTGSGVTSLLVLNAIYWCSWFNIDIDNLMKMILDFDSSFVFIITVSTD